MGLSFFTIPIQDSTGREAELNGFLSRHKVLAIKRRWVDLGTKHQYSKLTNRKQASGFIPGEVDIQPSHDRLTTSASRRFYTGDK